MNQSLLNTLHPDDVDVMIQRVEEAEVDEMWSYVGKKHEQRWLWHAIDHQTGKVLAYVFGRRRDEVFLQLKALLAPFGITRYDTDYWGAYTRHLDPDEHNPGKRYTQQTQLYSRVGFVHAFRPLSTAQVVSIWGHIARGWRDG